MNPSRARLLAICVAGVGASVALLRGIVGLLA